MESSLLEFGDSELDKSAAYETTITDRRYIGADSAKQFDSEVALAPVPIARRTIWRELRVKVIPAVVFLLLVVAIIYLWPPF